MQIGKHNVYDVATIPIVAVSNRAGRNIESSFFRLSASRILLHEWHARDARKAMLNRLAAADLRLGWRTLIGDDVVDSSDDWPMCESCSCLLPSQECGFGCKFNKKKPAHYWVLSGNLISYFTVSHTLVLTSRHTYLFLFDLYVTCAWHCRDAIVAKIVRISRTSDGRGCETERENERTRDFIPYRSRVRLYRFSL